MFHISRIEIDYRLNNTDHTGRLLPDHPFRLALAKKEVGSQVQDDDLVSLDSPHYTNNSKISYLI